MERAAAETRVSAASASKNGRDNAVECAGWLRGSAIGACVIEARAALLCRHAGVGVEEKIAGADGVGGSAKIFAREMHDGVAAVGGVVFGPVGQRLAV